MTENILEIKNIHKQYAAHKALDNVSITVPKGSIYGLLGPNGAGKTSLIRIINQITAPDAGEIFFNGQKLNPSHIEQIGYLPEERGLYKKMKVGEQLLYLAQLKGLKRADAVAKIKWWLTKLELSNWWDKDVENLSKGMQQKVQFISTVMHHPQLIILDEPFSGFDPINANIIKDEILELRKNGSTIIFSTHRMESVEELCDNICLINKSKKVLEGKLRDIKENHKTGKYKVVINTSQIIPESEFFQIVSLEKAIDETTEIILQMRHQKGSGALLQFLSKYGEILFFSEIIPTAQDIFIKNVSESDSN